MEEIKYVFKQTQYSIELKHKICKEHIETGSSLSDLTRKYNLSSHSLIHDWLRRFGYLPPTHRQISRRIYIETLNPIEMHLKKPSQSDSTLNNEEQREIAQLKKQLEDAQIQLDGYKRMIEIAEEEYKIPIRKKSNTK